jgi:hypothetical protein
MNRRPIPADKDHLGGIQLPRRYSLVEIDGMREDIHRSYPSGFSYYGPERAAEVELKLRTYMMAGIDPAEVREKRIAAVKADMEVLQQAHRAKLEAEAELERQQASMRTR